MITNRISRISRIRCTKGSDKLLYWAALNKLIDIVMIYNTYSDITLPNISSKMKAQLVLALAVISVELIQPISLDQRVSTAISYKVASTVMIKDLVCSVSSK